MESDKIKSIKQRLEKQIKDLIVQAVKESGANDIEVNVSTEFIGVNASGSIRNLKVNARLIY
jgi:hypothetical protein